MYRVIVEHQSLNDFGYGDDFGFGIFSLNGGKKNHERRTQTIKQNWNPPVEYGKQYSSNSYFLGTNAWILIEKNVYMTWSLPDFHIWRWMGMVELQAMRQTQHFQIV